MRKDEDPIITNSYSTIALGDSGGPVSAKVNILNKRPNSIKDAVEKRHVIVAIITNGGGLNSYLKSSECSIAVPKVSKDIVKWIKQLDSKYSDPGEILFPYFLKIFGNFKSSLETYILTMCHINYR